MRKRTTVVYKAAPPKRVWEREGLMPTDIKYDCCGGLTEKITITLETGTEHEDIVTKVMKKRLPRAGSGTMKELDMLTLMYDPMPSKKYLQEYGVDANALACTVQGGNTQVPQVFIEVDHEQAPRLMHALRMFAPGTIVYEAEPDAAMELDDGVLVLYGAQTGF